MSLFGTLQTGASGLGVSSSSLGVIGDNIANLNTIGYKRNRASFADMMPQNVFGMGGPSQLGRGAANMTIGGQFTQGSLMGTGNSLDVALDGQGWFQVNDGNEAFFTRDGAFGVDLDGYLVNNLGYQVQGYQATDGQLSSSVGSVMIDDNPIEPQATSAITLDLVLQNGDPNTAGNYGALTLDGNTTTIDAAEAEGDFSTSITVYDSLGQAHDVVVVFEQVDANTWDYSAIIDGGDVDLGGGVMGTPGMALEIAGGTLAFDTDGVLQSNTQTAGFPAWNWDGAAPWTPVIELGLDGAGGVTEGSVTNTAQDGESSVTGIAQDGFAMGDLSSLAVDTEGVIRGQYTNGEELILGQLAVATFDSEAGLDRAGGNLYSATYESGDPALGAAGTGTRGTTAGYALERSNVDLEDEFVDMIQAQRSYQANAGVIRTADETLQELVNLV